MPPITKKKTGFLYSSQKQNRQGFLKNYRLKPLILAVLRKHIAAKPLQPCIIVLLPILKNCYQKKDGIFVCTQRKKSIAGSD